ncbi:hypothetical protein [Streptomyces sp. NPDC005303]|uniref:hypothetical protein n=1 Tax=Streptomyces sp. NPDC005303 TaxID=3155713 RepID=UPI0033B585E9
MDDAIREARTFSTVLMTGGTCACIAAIVTGDVVPTILGVIAAVCGVVLAVFVFLTHRQTRQRHE